MTAKWKKFEQATFDKIYKQFSSDVVAFEQMGDSDSTTSDILVKNNNLPLFYIEVKSETSQAGQFVINKNNSNQWSFSKLNKTRPTKNSDKIISFINRNIESNIGTGQTLLDIDEDVIFNWIKDFYRERKVKFIATEFNKQLVIVPLNKIDIYFEVSGTVRKKGSGSGEATEPFWNSIKNLPIFNNVIENKRINGKRYLTFKTIPNSISSEKEVFEEIINDELVRFQLEDKGDNVLYIRKLSSTSNPTVIFTLKSKENQKQKDLETFKDSLFKK